MIKLIYMSNFIRKHIGTVYPSPEAAYESVLSEILIHFENAGISVDKERKHLYVFSDGVLKTLSAEVFFLNTDIEVFYLDIIAPQNASSFYESDGIRFFFHTNEGNHLHYPHVHAENSGDEISISLEDFRVEGQFRSRKKQKIAIQFVQKNHVKFEEAWNKIIYERVDCKWEDLS